MTIVCTGFTAGSYYSNSDPDYGIITGTVKDDEGTPIEGAKVEATAVSGSYGAWTKTDANGGYELFLPPGLYDVKASKSKYNDDKEENELLSAGQTLVLDFVLVYKSGIKVTQEQATQEQQQLPLR